MDYVDKREGRIVSYSDGGLGVIIDGEKLGWEEFSKFFEMHESFCFELKFCDL